MSWKTDRYNTTKNKGKETQISMKLLTDTQSFRVRASSRVMGQQMEPFHDSIDGHEQAFQTYQMLCAEAVAEGYTPIEGHPMLQATNPAAQAAIDNAYHEEVSA